MHLSHFTHEARYKGIFGGSYPCLIIACWYEVSLHVVVTNGPDKEEKRAQLDNFRKRIKYYLEWFLYETKHVFHLFLNSVTLYI